MADGMERKSLLGVQLRLKGSLYVSVEALRVFNLAFETRTPKDVVFGLSRLQLLKHFPDLKFWEVGDTQFYELRDQWSSCALPAHGYQSALSFGTIKQTLPPPLEVLPTEWCTEGIASAASSSTPYPGPLPRRAGPPPRAQRPEAHTRG